MNTISREFQIYKQIYNLPTIISESEVIEKDFNYVTRKEFFIILILYDSRGKVYLKDDFSLLGGTVYEDEHIRNSLMRFVSFIDGSMEVDEVEPIAFLENTFIFEKNSHHHYGIAMCAKIRSSNARIKSNMFIIGDCIDKIERYGNRNILALFFKRFQDIISKNLNNFQENEIIANKDSQKRYEFHNNFVKKFILTDKLKRKVDLIKLIQGKCSNATNLLDISCGDNSILFNFAENQNINYIVANDISWSQVQLIKNKSPKIFFTNHNAITFPFKENAFDVAYCSNTLHHMPSPQHICNLLKTLQRIAKKVIILEIENPKITGGFPHLLNKYWYIKFLKDFGEEYLSQDSFQSVIKGNCIGNIIFDNFRNIQGNYMIAEITKNSDNSII